jgi:hypothetical protein
MFVGIDMDMDEWWWWWCMVFIPGNPAMLPALYIEYGDV